MRRVDNIDNLLNIDQIFPNFKRILLNIYRDEYSFSLARLIEERIDNTYYLFDSTPDITLKFFTDNNITIPETVRLEIDNYLSKKEELTEKRNHEYYLKLCQAHNINSITYYNYKEAILNLPIDSFSKTSSSKLISKNTPYWDIQAINLKRYEYRYMCRKMNIEPINDLEVLEYLAQFKSNQDQCMNLTLLRDTIWGGKVTDKIRKECLESISDEMCVDWLFSNKPGMATVIQNGYNERHIIAYIPILKDFLAGNLDTSFFHENRHISEMHDTGCGMFEFAIRNYRTLTEVWTQKCAHEDEKKCSFEAFLFENKVSPYGIPYTYDLLFPFVFDLFEKYKDTFDYCATSGNIRKLEKLFGEKSFREYSKMLDDVYNVIATPNFTLDQKDKLLVYHNDFYAKYQELEHNAKR